MPKTLYYRKTDPKTGKQKWIKLPGVKSEGYMLFIDGRKWKVHRQKFEIPGDFVYKSKSSR
tara:strand:+ start:60 stop:242 length:183 start_codon:yes stop_codon:yes gene_type:complete